MAARICTLLALIATLPAGMPALAQTGVVVMHGKSDERGEFDEHEGAKGNWTVSATTAIYLT